MKSNRPDTEIRLPPDEWDFRRIPEPELGFAIAWEYARTSPSKCKEIEDYLARQVHGKPVRYWIGHPPDGRLARPRYAIELDLGSPAGLETIGVIMSFPPSTRVLQLLIFFCGDEFPNPWLRVESRPRPREVVDLSRPAAELLDLYTLARLPPIGLYPLGDRVAVLLDRWQTRSRIHQAVDRILDEDASEMGHDAPKLRGKASAPKYHLLKHLAAYRLAEAGVGYKVAWACLPKYRKEKPVSGGDVLPIYASQSGWDDAIKEARSELRLAARRADEPFLDAFLRYMRPPHPRSE